MTFAAALGVSGLRISLFNKVGKYAHTAAGLIMILCGIAVQFLRI